MARLAELAGSAGRHGKQLYVTGASLPVRRMLVANGVREPEVRYRPHVDDAVAEARAGAA